MINRLFCLIAGPVLLMHVLSAQEDFSNTTYVAKAGDLFISEREFQHRFELLPGFGRHRRSQLETAKGEFLYTLIAEKLLAQEAGARNMDRDTVYQQSFLSLRKKLSRDELYKIEIAQKVKVTPTEINEGMTRAQRLIKVSYLYFPGEGDARFVRTLMKSPADLEMMRIDSSIAFLRDTATVIWGDAEPVLEDAAYSLKTGTLSPVIKAGTGYYVIKILDVQTNRTYASLQQNILRDRVIEIIRLRKERKRLDEYVAGVLQKKRGYAVPSTFALLAGALQDVYRNGGKQYDGLFSPEVMDQVRSRCRTSLSDTLAVVGNSYWTLESVIFKLMNKIVRAERLDSADIPRILNTQIKILVQQELLEEEALSRGLDRTPSVQEKLELWRHAMLASLMKNHIRSTVTVSDSEVYSFLRSGDQKIEIPLVEVRLIKTPSLDQMNDAIEALHEGTSFSEAVRLWSVDSVTKIRGGTTGYFPITEKPPIGGLAWKMEIDEMYGPLMDDGGYVLFQVTGKKKGRPGADTLLAMQYQKVKVNLSNMKGKRTLDRFLAQTGRERGFTIFEERLKQIKVTPIPMMTFRILGFGGRIMEVPFVDPQLDWLNIEPPKTKVLP